ncbi:hypothetical protein FISHEDRAFT_22045, partial [Fistulina hepatica ATCC 64428]
SLDDTKLELAQMLNRLQRHTRCTPGYCLKRKPTGETYCHFGFPKPYRDVSEFAHDGTKPFKDFLTARNDDLLNSYNAGMILTWRANIDFRP